VQVLYCIVSGDENSSGVDQHDGNVVSGAYHGEDPGMELTEQQRSAARQQTPTSRAAATGHLSRRLTVDRPLVVSSFVCFQYI